jgi:hypothetical protein
MIYSMTPVNIQRSYEQAQRDDRKAADYPFGDPQIKELAKGQMEESNLLAAIYNVVVKGNETNQKKLDEQQQTLTQVIKMLTSPDFAKLLAQAVQQQLQTNTHPVAAVPSNPFAPPTTNRLLDVSA